MKFFISEHDDGITVTLNDLILAVEESTLEAVAFAQGAAMGTCKNPEKDLPAEISMAIFEPKINRFPTQNELLNAFVRGTAKGKESQPA
jgi:hypothetical protein